MIWAYAALVALVMVGAGMLITMLEYNRTPRFG